MTLCIEAATLYIHIYPGLVYMCLGGRAARLLARCAAGGAARGARDRRRCAWCDARTAAGRYVAREVRALEKNEIYKKIPR